VAGEADELGFQTIELRQAVGHRPERPRQVSDLVRPLVRQVLRGHEVAIGHRGRGFAQSAERAGQGIGRPDREHDRQQERDHGREQGGLRRSRTDLSSLPDLGLAILIERGRNVLEAGPGRFDDRLHLLEVVGGRFLSFLCDQRLHPIRGLLQRVHELLCGLHGVRVVNREEAKLLAHHGELLDHSEPVGLHDRVRHEVALVAVELGHVGAKSSEGVDVVGVDVLELLRQTLHPL
jgi:hypothetical protein